MESNSSEFPGEQLPDEVIEQMQAESAEPEPILRRGRLIVRSPLLNDPDNPKQTVESGTVGFDKNDGYYRHKKEPKND